MGNIRTLRARLRVIGLTNDEADILLCLIASPKTMLDVSRATGIPRSSVYRIVDDLAEKSLVCGVTTDNDKSLMSAQPEALELLVSEHEEASKVRRNELNTLLPLLGDLAGQDDNFAVRTYKGLAGIKQLLWKELKTKTEILIFSGAPLDAFAGRAWAERYRQEIIDRGIKQRCVENRAVPDITAHQEYNEHYEVRLIPESILTIKPEITIHDDTVCLYNAPFHPVRLATEIKNPFLAAFMREIFEHYWELAERE